MAVNQSDLQTQRNHQDPNDILHKARKHPAIHLEAQNTLNGHSHP